MTKTTDMQCEIHEFLRTELCILHKYSHLNDLCVICMRRLDATELALYYYLFNESVYDCSLSRLTMASEYEKKRFFALK